MPQTLTYCNPLPIPNYQRGRLSTNKAPGSSGWLREPRLDYREMADPSVIYHDGKWYLFPSCGQLWWSEDFVNWNFQPIEPFDAGYAPTVVKNGDWFYMTACGAGMYRSRSLLGPWELLGPIQDENGKPFQWNDPMLFVDDDGTMYGYHGLGRDGIYVARMRNDDPTRFAEPRRNCFAFDPSHPWEHFGEHNQHPDVSYIEGSWMNKIGGRYYLHYTGPGTEWSCYGLGCYIGDTPMGPWHYQKRNPILMHKGGLVNGCGHGCIVAGPKNTLWCFYTTLVRIEHPFERRIGMDPVGIDANGEIYVSGPSETPQLAPGINDHPELGNDAGWLNISACDPATASSFAPGHDPDYANDDHIRTWWEAAGPAPQWLAFDLMGKFTVRAFRTMFGDRGLNYDAGVLPGPYRYRIEGSLDGKDWTTLVDRSANTLDQHIAYDTCEPTPAKWVRLVVLEAPKGMSISVWEFTAFGRK